MQVNGQMDDIEATANGITDADVEAALSRANTFSPRKRKPLYEGKKVC